MSHTSCMIAHWNTQNSKNIQNTIQRTYGGHKTNKQHSKYVQYIEHTIIKIE
jgi:hypothetical protein